MELHIDLERSKTEDEYRDTGTPDRKTEALLRQELRDEVILRTISVRILQDGGVVWFGTLVMDYIPPDAREYTELPEPVPTVQANFPPGPSKSYQEFDPKP